MFKKILLNHSIYNQFSQTLMQQRGILREQETIPDAFNRVIYTLSSIDAQLYGEQKSQAFKDSLTKMVYNGTIILGTPILTNAGRPAQVTSACTVLPIHVRGGQADFKRFEIDSFQMLGQALGTGYDLSDVHDPVASLNTFNGILNKMNAQFIADKKRPVASMATLRADHPKILEFVRAKRDADFSQWRFNISVFINESFMQAAAKQAPWHLKDTSGHIVGEIRADVLLQEIAECAHYCGEPGVLFQDRLEEDNPTPNWRYQSAAPCAELAMAPGDACHFSYLNLSHFARGGSFNHTGFANAVHVLTRLLDNSVEYTLTQEADAQIHLPLVREKRRIGVSITGFADLLIKLNVPYDAPYASVLARQISELLDYHSKKASVSLAQARGAFPCFNESRYKEPAWIRRKLTRSSGVVSSHDWHNLYQAIEKHGIRNATTTSIPPSGTSSTIANVSKSLEPHFSFINFNGQIIPLIEKIVKTHFSASEQANLMTHIEQHGKFPDHVCAKIPFLKTACQISASAHLKVQEGFQSHLDDAVSKTANMDNNTAVEDVANIIWTSYNKGLKGVTIFRDGCLGERKFSPAKPQFFSDKSKTVDDASHLMNNNLFKVSTNL